ncbi:hypothetical protein D1641_13230 [Colidextribacter sp. OB.20]|uniref:hypothetical protein n=1 Tax=Colidextribacter sp. OB.20 TaxID=2304568 RepID=UPI001369D5A4|nr:hypothetical protein [Colidextribacter sp. OB.20]NBI10964.1 hypothetical protein [Colidextribacter sp. OB.20]
MDPLFKRMLKLMTVKSIVTLILTLVFAILALRGGIDQDFMTIYAVIISFYFGTQSQEGKAAGEGGVK